MSEQYHLHHHHHLIYVSRTLARARKLTPDIIKNQIDSHNIEDNNVSWNDFNQQQQQMLRLFMFVHLGVYSSLKSHLIFFFYLFLFFMLIPMNCIPTCYSFLCSLIQPVHVEFLYFIFFSFIQQDDRVELLLVVD